jgi:uncharacterized protein YjbI with pentapeptide repeats
MPEQVSFPAAGEQESWLRAGKSIEFPKQRPDSVDSKEWERLRTVEATSIAALTRNDVRSVGVAVRIVNAIITGPLRVAYATFSFEFSAINCDFQDEVDFSFCKFHGICAFRESRFHKAAKLNSVRASYDLQLDSTQFDEPVSLQAIEVQGRVFARGAHFKNANLTNAKFAKSVVFRALTNPGAPAVPTQFEGETSFSDAHFDSTAAFDGAQFLGKVDFSRCSIAGSALFRAVESDASWISARFAGETLFRECSIGGTADFRGAQFGEADTNFQLSKIGGGLYFRPAGEEPKLVCVHFGGNARFDGIQVGGRLGFDGAQLERSFSLEAAQIGGNVLCRAAWNSDTPIRFCGEANFRDTVIDGNGDFNGAEFHGNAIFSRTKFKGSAFFNSLKYKKKILRTAFLSTATFDDLDVQGLLSFLGVLFASTASFRRAQVKGNAFFGPAPLYEKLVTTKFRGDAIFNDAHFLSFADFSGALFRGQALLERVTIAGAAFFGPAERGDSVEACRFKQGLRFRDASVGGRAEFSAAGFKGVADFSGSKFGGVVAFNTLLRENRLLKTRVQGPIIFFRTDITDNLEMEGTEFSARATFESINVGRNVLLRAANFAAAGGRPAMLAPVEFKDVRFLDANIGGGADFKGATFSGDANFQRMKVGGPAIFGFLEKRDPEKKPTFHRVNFARAVLSGGADFDGVSVAHEFICTEATFGASSKFSRMYCGGNADFTLATVDGTATYQHSEFKGNLSLQDANIGIVNFGESSLDRTQFSGTVDLSGFSYTRFVGDWRQLLLRSPEDHLQPYVQVERVFRSAGYERDADEVFLARRYRERQLTKKRLLDQVRGRNGAGRLHALREFRVLLEDWIVGAIFNYGVASYRMLVVAFLLFILGALILSFPQALIPLAPNATAPVPLASNAIRLLRAIATFSATVLPGEKAAFLTQWKPSPFPIYKNSGLTFVQVSALLSWLMYACATISIASLAGLIKRKQT